MVSHTTSSTRLSSRFEFRDPMLVRARARLFDDRIELSGWRFFSHYRRTIPLDRIVHVDLKDEKELVLWLVDGEAVRLRISDAEIWQRELSTET